MKIKIKDLRTVCFGLVASLGYGQQVIDNVGIGLGGPNYGARIDVSSLKGWNGAWSRGFQIGENSDPNNLNLIMFGGKGTTSINGAPTLDYGFIGKDWNKAYMTFLPNGNVGVGTVSPITKLDVYGDISLNFQHGASPIFRAAFQNPNAGAIDFGDGSGWKFYIRRRNDNMKLVTFLDNGNVGVGTDNPSEKMEVNGGYIRITNSGKEGPALCLYNPEKTEAGAVWRMYNMTGPYGNSLQFWNYPNNFSNSNQRLVLHDNGDMSLNGNITLGKNLYASDLVSGGTNSWIFHTPDDGRNTLHIAPNSENNWKWDKGMVIKADGNVGVGITTPLGKLHVGDNTNAGVVLNNRISSVISQIPAQLSWAESGALGQAGDLIISPRTDISASVKFYTNDGKTISERFRISGLGNAALQGKLEAKEIKVTTTPTADFVFADDYNLPKLEEVEKHVKEKRHLPEIASAKEMEKEGVNVGAFQIKLLQKIEELTLYVIQQKKQLEIQNKRIEELEKKNRK
ncbi:hypothetical protein BWK63_01830 [Flavobacterium covae]|uniref:Peptidase S74 domain-containing protein n=1 Tax=Flavobacterium covae TaxID=2906076 RepID=A0ABW8PFU4_9FLAO|nr:MULTISPECIES: hypothetical protein [Flavobacterium]OWP82212.1 hypothetical protein BWK63_01830 [Flavobacterium covae]POR20984.1 hypothetical protein BWK57_11725 [Flavobacterium columnare]